MTETPEPRSVAATEKIAMRVVTLLLIVAALSVFVLWTVNPIGPAEESTFALFIGVDLTAVAMISYVQRSVTESGKIGRTPMVAGSVLILVLIATAFYILG